ncbi:MAG: hypothetical protein OXC91_10735 [Rhodobacteraceae bacterium]|nr:hypothetical protein [Paracoccaceae bacterium]
MAMTFLAEMPNWPFLFLGAIISAIIGGIVTWLLMVIRNRRVPLTYHVRYDPIGISGSDSIHGKVEVTIGGTPAQKLYMSNIRLTNRGWRDVKDLEVKVYCSQDMRLASESAYIEGEPIALKHTGEHQGEWTRLGKAIENREQAMTSGDQAEVQRLNHAMDPIFRSLSTSRCYAVPVLMRGQTARFTHMTKVAHNAEPGIFLSCQKAGVRVQYKEPFQPIWHLWGVPRLKPGLPASSCPVSFGWW